MLIRQSNKRFAYTGFGIMQCDLQTLSMVCVTFILAFLCRYKSRCFYLFSDGQFGCILLFAFEENVIRIGKKSPELNRLQSFKEEKKQQYASNLDDTISMHIT